MQRGPRDDRKGRLGGGVLTDCLEVVPLSLYHSVEFVLYFSSSHAPFFGFTITGIKYLGRTHLSRVRFLLRVWRPVSGSSKDR